MSLSADLRALGPLVAPEERRPQDPELPRAELCPRLRTTYSPRAGWRALAAAMRQDEAPQRPEWSRVWDPGPPAPDLGSSLARNPKRPPRYGLNGLTSGGRRAIWRSLSLLEEHRDKLVFWTVTLPPEVLAALAEADKLAAFQDRIRKELLRRLEAAGAPPLVIGVAELQPARTMRERRPAPHWHVVFMNRRSRRKGDYYLSLEELDGVIRSACVTVGLWWADIRSAGSCEPVRKSVRAYMAKYMSKGSQDGRRWAGTKHEALLPRQWWFWSAALRQLVLQHVFPIAFPLLAWVHEHRRELEARELLTSRKIPLSDPRAPDAFEIAWRSCEALAEIVAMWQTDRWDAQWFLNHWVSTWQPST